ncbi:histidine phosphatase family protein [Microlunatus elymi]|uniref:Histidine phosphatase family protein n=1 Tax=Microlunatus elymi TaxID=2596828 RepID=A0A516PXV1_9ACTN|nr:histidine phosphatase family protein [Microlunatus elymi]QDP95982.1 histidine phosphatase family protein [Microlunatus elymi]
MSAERLIIWRHGRTPWNATGRYQGQADIGLDDLGRRQAEAAAKMIKELKPTAIIASDLSRAADTAAALAAQTGLEVAYDQRLREIHVGGWEGLTVEEAREIDPDRVDAVAAGIDVRRSETGELTSEVAHRVAEAFADIVERAEDGATVVITMHGLAGRVGIAEFLGVEHTALGGLRNCAWVILDRHPRGHWYIGGYNLQAELSVPDDDRVA